MIKTGSYLYEGKQLDWRCEWLERRSVYGIDGGRVVRVSVSVDGKLCGVKSRDYCGMPREPFVETLIEALIERFEWGDI